MMIQTIIQKILKKSKNKIFELEYLNIYKGEYFKFKFK